MPRAKYKVIRKKEGKLFSLAGDKGVAEYCEDKNEAEYCAKVLNKHKGSFGASYHVRKAK